MYKQLQTDGYLVIPVLSSQVLALTREQLKMEMLDMPEFKNGMKGFVDGFVMGGFSALGNPSSFHLPTVRLLRLWVQNVGFDIFKEVMPEFNMEQIVDRLLFRPTTKRVSSESWHRDETPCKDTVFGGWINLDFKDQYFSGCPGTHLDMSSQAGFNKISKEEYAKYEKLKKEICIPPGHLFIFYEHMVHEVKPSKSEMLRLFVGWRLTKSTQSIHGEELKKYLETQASIPVKSGQKAPMYAHMHWTNWVDKIKQFSENIQDVCKEHKQRGGKTPGMYHVVHRYMKSLKEYNLEMYPSYTKEELDILMPNTQFKTLKMGSESEYHILKL
tara:strand:- start:663 stop:1646 length:984 start_codon:yes stop_codon:yes gene_type:complete